MKIEHFREIDAHFATRGKGSNLARLAYSIFVDNVEAAIKSQGLTGVAMDDPRVQSICQGYTTNTQLDSYIILVEKSAETSIKPNRVGEFWFGIITSIAGNLVFALIVLGLYAYFAAPSDPAEMMNRIGS